MRFVKAAFLGAALAVAGCSGGGGSSSPAPAPVIPAGSGENVAFNQSISFEIIVPAPAAASRLKRRLPGSSRRAPAASPAPVATPAPTTPYVSPATAAIVLTIAEVNGISPRKAPPPIPAIPVTCQACTFTAPNIPAARGVDRYFVQTYSGYANGRATGNLISTGFVDVSVPATNPPNIGGAAALSIGGYVASISLAPTTIDFQNGVAATANVLVRALDAGGATIIGAVQFVSPIVVSVTDQVNFTVDGATSESIAQNLQRPIALHYSGGNSFGTLVNATTLDENGNTVNATPVEAGILFPTPAPGVSPTPPPPPPSPTPPPKTTSLYVADGATDTVSEYGFVAALEGGNVPSPVPTPRRVMQFNPALIVNKIPTLACTSSPFSLVPFGTGNGTQGVTLGSDGTIFTFPTCFDGTNTYIFGFPATSVGPTAPSILDPINQNGTGLGPSIALATNVARTTVYGELSESENVIAGFPATSNGQQPAVQVGLDCFQEFTYPACSSGSYSFSPGFSPGFGVDGNGYAYLTASWNDTAIGDAANLILAPAVLTVPVSSSGSPNTPTLPFSAIAGFNSLIGGTGAPGLATTVDGTTLYVLTGTAPLTDINNNTYYPGLSSCPPPSSNAPLNAPVDPNNPVTNCVDQQQHLYLTAYPLNAQLLGIQANNTDVDLTPIFTIGGDVVGGFGCSLMNGGQVLAVSAGYVYIINQQPNCNNNAAPEIDVYNTNGVTGSHTDIAPVLRINLNSSYPSALVIGPSGTVTGGQSLLRSPRTHGFRSTMYHWPAKRRAKARPRMWPAQPNH